MITKVVTPAEQEAALSDMRLKMRLEDGFTPAMVAFLIALNADFVRFFRLSGRVLDVTAHRDELQTLLARHYADTSVAFEDRVLLPPLTDEELTRIAALRDGALTPLLIARPPIQTDLILGTVSDSLNQAVDIVERDIPELTTAETGAAAAARYGASIPGVADNISITETQAVAELTKFSEVTAAAVVIGRVPQKTWVTVGDALVRDAHAAANGQERGVAVAFDVGGEQLNAPGDTSLGASIDNVARCRCSAVYGFTL